MIWDFEPIKRFTCELFPNPFPFASYIDQGKNPQLYTKDCMEKALAKNEQVKGKIDTYQKFRSLLLVELSQAFPNAIKKFKSIRGDERPT